MKKYKQLIIGIIIGIALSITTVYSESLIESKNVLYDNSKSKMAATNVEGAIDELYQKIDELNKEKEEQYKLGYDTGYKKAVENTNATAATVLSGYTFSSAKGYKLTGTMPDYSKYVSGITLTKTDGRVVYVRRVASGDSGVWKLANSDGVTRSCILVPRGYWDGSRIICTPDI